MRVAMLATLLLVSLSPALAQGDLAKADALLKAGLEDDAIRLLVELAYDEEDSPETAGALFRLANIKIDRGEREEGVRILQGIVARFGRPATDAARKLLELGEPVEMPAARLGPEPAPAQEVCPLRVRISVEELLELPKIGGRAVLYVSRVTCNGVKISRLLVTAKRSKKRLSVSADVSVFLPEGEDRNISHGLKLVSGDSVLTSESSRTPFRGDEGENNDLSGLSVSLKKDELAQCGEACDVEVFVKTVKRKFFGH